MFLNKYLQIYYLLHLGIPRYYKIEQIFRDSKSHAILDQIKSIECWLVYGLVARSTSTEENQQIFSVIENTENKYRQILTKRAN